VGRWEPDARGRLEQAALELYNEKGFDQTTVAEIAQRAGLTERTFFRYFADKREVLFGGAGLLQEGLVQAIGAAPEGTPALDTVVGALQVVGATFDDRRERSRRRQAVVVANAELLERELVKLATLARAAAAALRERGVAEPAASLSAEAGIAIFKVAFERWVATARGPRLPRLIKDTADELRAVAG
jgi:AcrR family transcriptional regulator